MDAPLCKFTVTSWHGVSTVTVDRRGNVAAQQEEGGDAKADWRPAGGAHTALYASLATQDTRHRAGGEGGGEEEHSDATVVTRDAAGAIWLHRLRYIPRTPQLQHVVSAHLRTEGGEPRAIDWNPHSDDVALLLADGTIALASAREGSTEAVAAVDVEGDCDFDLGAGNCTIKRTPKHIAVCAFSRRHASLVLSVYETLYNRRVTHEVLRQTHDCAGQPLRCALAPPNTLVVTRGEATEVVRTPLPETSTLRDAVQLHRNPPRAPAATVDLQSLLDAPASTTVSRAQLEAAVADQAAPLSTAQLVGWLQTREHDPAAPGPLVAEPERPDLWDAVLRLEGSARSVALVNYFRSVRFVGVPHLLEGLGLATGTPEDDTRLVEAVVLALGTAAPRVLPLVSDRQLLAVLRFCGVALGQLMSGTRSQAGGQELLRLSGLVLDSQFEALRTARGELAEALAALNERVGAYVQALDEMATASAFLTAFVPLAGSKLRPHKWTKNFTATTFTPSVPYAGGCHTDAPLPRGAQPMTV